MTEEDAGLAKKRILIDLINRETDQFAIEQKRQGWTTWALLGALSTIVWLLVNQVPFTTVSWQNVGLLFFSLALTIDLIRLFCSLFTVQPGNNPKEPRFIFTSIFGGARISILIQLALYCILFFISFKLKINVFAVSRIILQIWLGFQILGGLLGFIFSYRRLLISKFQISRASTFALFLLTAPLAFSIMGYYVALVTNFTSFGQSDIKVAVLLVLIACVLVLLANLPVISPMLSSLVLIRRDLALDKIDIDWAAKQVDIALSGMRVGDILQENIKEMLDYYDTINNVLIKLTKTSEAIEKFIPVEPSDLKKEEFSSNWKAVEALGEGFKRDADYLSSMQKRLMTSMDKFDARTKQIMSMDKRSADAIEEVIGLIKAAHDESNRVNAIERKQIASLNARLSAVRTSLITASS